MKPRILVDHNGPKGIGDIVCELGFYEALRLSQPDAEICSRGSRELAWGHPEIDAFDESSPDTAFSRILRLQDIYKVARSLPAGLAQGRTIFDQFLICEGFEPLSKPPALYVLPEEIERLGLSEDAGEQLLIAFSIDSKEPSRRWGEERFRALIEHIQQTYDVMLVELGIGIQAGHLGIGYDLVGQTDLRETMAVLSAADLFIGNHGGLTHLAGGVGTPALTPWGATHPYAAYAYDTVSVAVETTPPCRHCNWTGGVLPACKAADPQTGRTSCTQEISVDQMIKAADGLITRLGEMKQALRRARYARRTTARKPESLSLFEHQVQQKADFSHPAITIGGTAGWNWEHVKDNYARLNKIVAFPDWEGHPSEWKSLMTAFIGQFDADSPWLLQLSAYPLTGPEVMDTIKQFLLEELRPSKSVPKMLIYQGHLTAPERQWLLEQAANRVELAGSPYATN